MADNHQSGPPPHLSVAEAPPPPAAAAAQDPRRGAGATSTPASISAFGNSSSGFPDLWQSCSSSRRALLAFVAFTLIVAQVVYLVATDKGEQSAAGGGLPLGASLRPCAEAELKAQVQELKDELARGKQATAFSSSSADSSAKNAERLEQISKALAASQFEVNFLKAGLAEKEEATRAAKEQIAKITSEVSKERDVKKEATRAAEEQIAKLTSEVSEERDRASEANKMIINLKAASTEALAKALDKQSMVGPSGGAAKDRLLYMAILSGPRNKDRRQQCRQSYVNSVRKGIWKGVTAEFIIGHLPYEGSGQGTLPTSHMMKVEKEILQERKEHGDIARIVLPERYENLPDKTYYILRRAAQQGWQWVLKIDDDQMPVMRGVLAFCKCTDWRLNVYAGAYLWDRAAYNSQKGADGQFAAYFSGPGYLVSYGLAQNVAIIHESQTAEFLTYGSSSEDVDMGRWAQNVGRHGPAVGIFIGPCTQGHTEKGQLRMLDTQVSLSELHCPTVLRMFRTIQAPGKLQLATTPQPPALELLPTPQPPLSPQQLLSTSILPPATGMLV